MYYYDSDNESDGSPYFTIIDELREGDLLAIRSALSDRPWLANQTSRGYDNYTVLHYAAAMTDEDGLEEATHFKYSRKFDIRREIVRLLLNHGAKAWIIWWQQSFCHISGERTWDMTEDKKTQVMLMKACCQQLKEALVNGQEVKQELKNSALCAAAALNQIDILRDALENGADIDNNVCDYTALSSAAENGSLDAVRFLVGESAKIDHAINENGRRALSCAMCAGETEIVKCLIDKGADIFYSEYLVGHCLFSCDIAAAIQVVLESMMEKHSLLLHSNVAFECFVGFDCIEGLQLLVEGGAEFPNDILQKAVVRGRKESLEYLIAHGALKNHDPKAEKVYAYGSMKNTCTKGAVLECQKILDDSIEAKEEWERLAAA